jgi:glutamyl-tRNA reductase
MAAPEASPRGLFCLGLSHKSAPIHIREKVAISAKALGAAAAEITALPGLHEAVVLSTCNRMEIYTAATSAQEAGVVRGQLLGWLEHKCAQPLAEYHASFFSHQHQEAAEHLFSVASGMDSMVLGETEIFGQVKDAYQAAHASGATGRLLNKLFQEAFRAGKAVRNTTDIQRGATSVGGVAVELAEKLFGELKDCTVMLLGAGDISRRTAQSLQNRGARSMIVSNRNYDRAVEMAAEMQGQALHFEQWPQKISQVDILICSTAAPHAVVQVEDLLPGLKRRRGGRPLFIIDIAVPRDVEPAVNDLANVYLFDIDSIQGIANQGIQRRERELAKCKELISKFLESSVIREATPFRL